MAKNCIACGKSIGLLSVRIPLINDELVICADCFEKMPGIINDLYQNKISPSKSELIGIKEDVVKHLQVSCYNQDTINVVAKFLDDKIAKTKDEVSSEIGKVFKKCPICKKNVNYDTEVCSDCGYIFDNVTALTNVEIAQIYNNRIEQYKKNPFYEYDYIVVPNKSDGSVDRETVKGIISSHAMQGWRLIIMYSNELGHTGLEIGGVGSNTTECEDILVFERCINS